jgi:uncharacterized membrane protein YdjX (TVP38/TMEM64 family)
MEQDDPKSNALESGGGAGRWLALLLGAALVLLAARRLPIGSWLDAARGWVESAGPLAFAAYVAVYVASVLLLIPGTLATLAAGPLFGLWLGTAAVSLASTTAAALAFLIARYAARAAVAARARREPRFAAVDRAIGAKGWRIVALLRLSPFFPYPILNYLFGLTPIRFWPYVAATWLAMLPATFLYVYLSHAGAQGLAGVEVGVSVETVLIGLALVVTVAVTIYVTRLALRAVRVEAGPGEPAEGAEL